MQKKQRKMTEIKKRIGATMVNVDPREFQSRERCFEITKKSMISGMSQLSQCESVNFDVTDSLFLAESTVNSGRWEGVSQFESVESAFSIFFTTKKNFQITDSIDSVRKKFNKIKEKNESQTTLVIDSSDSH